MVTGGKRPDLYNYGDISTNILEGNDESESNVHREITSKDQRQNNNINA